MRTMPELSEIARRWPEELLKQKEQGKKIIGYTGRFVPEELIRASGAIPHLLCRAGQPEAPEAVIPYMLRCMSPFSRAQIGYHLLGLDPVIPILDCIIAQCDDCHQSHLADLFEYFELPSVRIGVPPDWKKSIARDYYHNGLNKLKDKLVEITGNEISDEDLKQEIKSLNKLRGLLEKINMLRKRQPPPIGGYDFIRLNHMSFTCNMENFLEKLKKLYQQLKDAPGPFSKKAPRIVIAGHVIAIGDYIILKMIEESGGVVVAEFLDEGIRHSMWDVGNSGDLLKNLSETYYQKRTPPSLFQPAWDQRLESIKKLVNDFRADGLIWYQISFEELYSMECSLVSNAMQEMEIPFLRIESSYEYSREAMGPLTTRIESFVESIKFNRG